MEHADRYRRRPATDIFTCYKDIDRRQCTRKVPLKVLILGLGRTGTASIRAAMSQLGYVDTYHMMSCSIENPPDALLWMDALCAKYDGVGKPFTRNEWDMLLGECQAVCDWLLQLSQKSLSRHAPKREGGRFKVVLAGKGSS